MDLDQHPNDTEGSPPTPPPKPKLESPLSTPIMLHKPPSLFNTPSISHLSSPSQHPGSIDSLSSHIDGAGLSQPSSPARLAESTASLSSQVDGASEDLLMPPSINPTTDDPTAPPSPSASSFQGKQSKRSNPFIDLVESEREYIDILASIIRKVAGAWSRTNFPPKELDVMFRSIESLYKANKGLLTKLKDIGPTPTSPKALGDILMRWIDDLDMPYTKYCTNFATGFDQWHLITSNARLPPILISVSKTHPPPSTLLPPSTVGSDSDVSPIWTLDALFALPRARLKYYKKLYTRLLKSTQAGRSDHKLLTGAVNKLENFLSILVERESVVVGVDGSDKKPDSTLPKDAGADFSSAERTKIWAGRTISTSSETTDDQARLSAESSAPHTSLSSDVQASRDTDFSRAGGRTASSATMAMPISNLEGRLSTENTLDIFTLKPRAVRLQMNPPSLPFTRTLRLSCDVEVHFTPRVAPDSPRVHNRGHIFLLTDLFLVCERMTPDERQNMNSKSDGQDYDMWLLYPPLAGKHLRVSESAEQDNVLQILVMKKETLILHAASKQVRDRLINELKECIEAANLLSPQAGQQSPPPVPPIKPMLQSISDPMLHQRDSQSSANSRPASSMSLVTGSGLAPNPQPFQSDQGMPRGPALLSSPHRSLPAQPDTQPSSTHPTTEGKGLPNLSSTSVWPTDARGARVNPSSSPQLQIQILGSPVHQLQQTSNMLAATHYVSPRVASSSHHLVAMDTPVRPTTAPGGGQTGGLPLQTGYLEQYPPHMQNSRPGYPLPGAYPNGHDQSSSSGRPPSDPMTSARPRKSPSAYSLGSQYTNGTPRGPGYLTSYHSQSPTGFSPHDGSINFSTVPHVHQPHPRVPLPPSATFSQRGSSFVTTPSWGPSTREPSPPSSPLYDEPAPQGPVTSSITAQFKCKVFLKLDHGQWKSLGGARLKLYLQQPTNVKQLVAEGESKDKTILISTIVLTDGVERVGKTGVAIELSDQGTRTGIVYMIQLRNETSASGLFNSLLAGSDRAVGRAG